MAVHQVNPQGSKLAALDPIWDRVRNEAEDIVRREPELASFIYSTVLHHERLEDSVIHRLAERLDHSALSGDLIRQTYEEARRDEPDLGNAFRPELDDVSILHGVTLGGTAKENEDRHPKIRHGVLIGAGAKILGNIEIGHCARIAAGSVVVKEVPHNVTVAGVPAKIVGEAGCAEPSRTMDQMLGAIGL